MFLLFYREFISSLDVFQSLERIFRSSKDKDRTISLRVLAILKEWIREYPEDFDCTALKDRFDVFCIEAKAFAPKVTGSIFRSSFKKRKREISPFSIDWTIENRSIELHRLSAKEVAVHLTVLHFNAFQRISRNDLANHRWTKSTNSTQVFVELFNKTSYMVASIVLRQSTPKLRKKLFRYFVDVAEQCLRLNSFSSVFAILCGINCSAVFRLKHLKHILQGKHLQVMERLQNIVSSSNNYSVYRNMVKSSLANLTPCVPHLAVHLQDLFKLQELYLSCKTMEPFQKGTVHNNRLLQCYSIIGDILSAQNVMFPLNPDPQTLSIVLHEIHSSKSETDLLAVSESLEPRMSIEEFRRSSVLSAFEEIGLIESFE